MLTITVKETRNVEEHVVHLSSVCVSIYIL